MGAASFRENPDETGLLYSKNDIQLLAMESNRMGGAFNKISWLLREY